MSKEQEIDLSDSSVVPDIKEVVEEPKPQVPATSTTEISDDDIVDGLHTIKEREDKDTITNGLMDVFKLKLEKIKKDGEDCSNSDIRTITSVGEVVNNQITTTAKTRASSQQSGSDAQAEVLYKALKKLDEDNKKEKAVVNLTPETDTRKLSLDAEDLVDAEIVPEIDSDVTRGNSDLEKLIPKG